MFGCYIAARSLLLCEFVIAEYVGDNRLMLRLLLTGWALRKLRQTLKCYQWRNYVGSALRQTFPRRTTDFSERELTFMYARPSVVCLSVVCNVRAPYSVG